MGSSWDLGPYFCDNPHHALLHHVLRNEVGRYPRQIVKQFEGGIIQIADGMEYGVALEFGVGEGHSLRCIAEWMPVIGYDSFEGLPEDWRPGFEKGAFASDRPTELPPNVDIVEGLFEDTLPDFDAAKLQEPVRLIHIDCDLFSSTRTALQRCRNVITPGVVIIFDEWWGYPEAYLHEQQAWRAFADKTGVQWDVIGHGVQQWAIRITS